MLHNGRRLSAARSWANAREEFSRVLAESDDLQHELEALQREVGELRAELAELRSICLDLTRGLREGADRDIAQLRRQLEIALVRLHQRGVTPLH